MNWRVLVQRAMGPQFIIVTRVGLQDRDGWGGAKPQYLDLFNPNAPTMQMTDRSGCIRIEDVKWRKPVVMLVNRGTRSGKEAFAFGFKQYLSLS
jgi:C-terminal processing protease CtpA/Prc